MNKLKSLGIGVAILVASSVGAMAQTVEADPNDMVAGAASLSQAAWIGFATLSATAFIFGMVIGYSRKGKK